MSYDKMEKDLEHRKKKAWRGYWTLSEVFKGNKLKLLLKTKILESCVIPCLAYSAQTWTLTLWQESSLQTIQRSMVRSMLGRNDQIRNTTIREQTGARDITKVVRQLKMDYAGHL